MTWRALCSHAGGDLLRHLGRGKGEEGMGEGTERDEEIKRDGGADRGRQGR